MEKWQNPIETLITNVNPLSTSPAPPPKLAISRKPLSCRPCPLWGLLSVWWFQGPDLNTGPAVCLLLKLFSLSPDIVICQGIAVLCWSLFIFPHTLAIPYCYLSYPVPWKADPLRKHLSWCFPIHTPLSWATGRQRHKLNGTHRVRAGYFFTVLWLLWIACSGFILPSLQLPGHLPTALALSRPCSSSPVASGLGVLRTFPSCCCRFWEFQYPSLILLPCSWRSVHYPFIGVSWAACSCSCQDLFSSQYLL